MKTKKDAANIENSITMVLYRRCKGAEWGGILIFYIWAELKNLHSVFTNNNFVLFCLMFPASKPQ